MATKPQQPVMKAAHLDRQTENALNFQPQSVSSRMNHRKCELLDESTEEVDHHSEEERLNEGFSWED